MKLNGHSAGIKPVSGGSEVARMTRRLFLQTKALKYSGFGADEATEGGAVTVYILRRFRLASNRFCTVVQNTRGLTFRAAMVAILVSVARKLGR